MVLCSLELSIKINDLNILRRIKQPQSRTFKTISNEHKRTRFKQRDSKGTGVPKQTTFRVHKTASGPAEKFVPIRVSRIDSSTRYCQYSI